MQNDATPNNELVVGAPAAEVNAGTQIPYSQGFPPMQRRPVMDDAAANKMTPQILVLLVIAGFKRNWKWALPLGLALAAIAFGTLWFVFPIKFEATAWIQVLTTKPHYIFEEKQQRQFEQFINTQFALMRSPIIIEKALENPVVAQMYCVKREKDKVGWLSSKLKLQTQGKSEWITVAFDAEEAKDAAEIVNSVVNAYFEYYENQNSDWNTRLINQLTLELNRQQNAARLLQEEIRSGLERAAQKGGAAGKDGGSMSGGLNQGESILRDLYLNESKLEALRAEVKSLKEYSIEGPNKIPQSVLENALMQDPVLLSYAEQKSQLEAKLESLKSSLPNEQDPLILTQKDKIKKLEERMRGYYSKMGDNKISEIRRGMVANTDQGIWERENAVRTQEILVENLRAKYKEQNVQVGQRTVEIADVSFQQEQLKRINQVLDLLQTRVVTLQTEMTAPAQVQLKKKASIPTEPNDKKRLPLSVMGGLACFLFPFFLGVAIERMKPRLYHVSQVRNAIPNVLIGEIMEPPVAWVQGASFRKRLARYRESVHSWCTHLLLSDPFRSCRTLAVASVSGDDGKTFLAVQVAVAMAQMKSGPVLLMDGDMRVGRLHLLFGNEETGIGLADVLSFRNGIGEAIVMNEKEPNLHLLSAGQLDVSPYELLGDGRFRELLDSLERDFSLVLVVVPPVTHAAESLVMAASCDSTLLCVRQGETVLAAMEDVFRKLENTGSHVDGIVVKDIPYYQMAGKDGGFADKLEQVRLAHLLQYSD